MPFIYGLVDPRTDSIVYVGKANDVQVRLRKHLADGEDTRKNRWLRKLCESGLTPGVRVLEECGEDVWPERERHWIAHFKSLGYDLLNGDDGGYGGRTLSEETRRKMSSAHLGVQHSDAHRLAVSLAKRRPITFKDIVLAVQNHTFSSMDDLASHLDTSRCLLGSRIAAAGLTWRVFVKYFSASRIGHATC